MIQPRSISVTKFERLRGGFKGERLAPLWQVRCGYHNDNLPDGGSRCWDSILISLKQCE